MRYRILFVAIIIAFFTLLTVFHASGASNNTALSGGQINDFYAFESPENPESIVFVATIGELLSPSETATATFMTDLMVEFNIDNNGDKEEDLVIQCIFTETEMKVYGPTKPLQPGTISGLKSFVDEMTVTISTYNSPAASTESDGMKIFAGPRDAPCFFDFNKYEEVTSGISTEFTHPGNDFYSGKNMLAVIVEVPKASLNGSQLNTWVETKILQ